MEQVIIYGGITTIPAYNCSAMTPEEWSERDGVKHFWPGVLDIIYGTIIILLYIPCLFVFLRKDLFCFSCFKIMFFLGIIDIAAICVNSLLTGVLLIEGAVYCTHPVLIFTAGSIAVGLWGAASLLCLLLVLNRVLDIVYPTIVKTYFHGYSFMCIMMLPVLYQLCFTFFTPPGAFTSKFQTWFFDPLIFPNKTLEYSNYLHMINNFSVVVITALLYAFFCVKILMFRSTAKAAVGSKQYAILIQTSLICLVNLIASFIYVAMQFVPISPWIILCGQYGWQLCHGCPAVIYMAMNRTVRTAVRKMLCIEPKKISGSKGLGSDSHVHSATNFAENSFH